MKLFTIRMTYGKEVYSADYDSIDECLRDVGLCRLLDNGNAKCSIWRGEQRISGRPISSSAELREALVSNSLAILHRYRS